jgi:N utilization substance protein B
MKPIFSPKNNPRVIIIQILYGKYYNNDQNIIIPKHRFKKFIKDVVFGTIERNEVIIKEIKKYLDTDINLKEHDKIFLIILKSAIYELLYKPTTSSKIIIKEYLNASNFFIEDAKTKYLNALLDKISKNLRLINE